MSSATRSAALSPEDLVALRHAVLLSGLRLLRFETPLQVRDVGWHFLLCLAAHELMENANKIKKIIK